MTALQAAPVLKCLSKFGGFENGSGTDGGTSFRSASLLCNDGTAYFVAPMRPVDNPPASASSKLPALYAGNAFSGDGDCTLLQSGYNEIFYVITGLVNETGRMRVAGDAARSVVFSTARDVPVFGSRSVFITQCGAEDRKVIVGNADFPSNASLSVSGDGSLIALGDLSGAYHFLDSSLNAIGIDLEGDGRSVGISPDGNVVIFASAALAGNDSGLLWIYSYNRAADEIQPLLQVQDAAHGILQNGAEISYAANSNAFAFVTNRSSLLDDSGNDYVNRYGTQVVLAKMDDDGEWTTIWCDTGTHLHHCASPAVSADGRYVAFTASVDGHEVAQTFRFDSVKGELNCVSMNGAYSDGRCYSPSISPNGRYVGFVTNAGNLGYANIYDTTNAWVADCGPILDYEPEIYVYGTLPNPLPISTDALGDGATLAISWNGDLPGELYWLDGATKVVVANGAAFTADCGTLYFRPNGTRNDSIALGIVLKDGGFTLRKECLLHCLDRAYPSVSHLSYVMDGNDRVLANAGGYSLSGGRFAISANGKAVAFTTVAKSRTETYNATAIVVRNSSGVSRTIENCGVTGRMELSGDGKSLFYVTVEGVRKYAVSNGASSLFIGGADDFAVSYDGSVCAYVKDGLPYVAEECISEEAGFTKPLLSRDGAVAAFINGGSLYVWKGGELRKFADGVTQAFMPMSGASFLVEQDGALKWIGAKEGVVDLPYALSEMTALSLSANGRFLAYCRTDGTQQAFRYDMLAAKEESFSVELDGTYANAAVNARTAISANGAMILFATAATNFVEGKVSPLRNELYVAESKTDVNAAARADAALSFDETDSAVVLPLSFADDEGNDAVPELLAAPSDVECELLPPDWEHPWYALKATPQQEHLCGLFKIGMRFWDGTAWSATQEVALDIVNVNDAPFWKDGATAEYTVAEAETATGADYSTFADDCDLANPSPYDNESLSFALKGAPAWATIADGVLKLAPGYDVTTSGMDLRAEFSVVVKDAAGETAELPVAVTVTNTNRSPVIGATAIEIREGEEVAWAQFAASDPDAGDSLSLRLSSTNGWWLDKDGNAVSGDVAESRFPIRFAAKSGLFNEQSESAFAVDGDGAVSESKATVKILLNMVKFSASDIWPELFADNVSGWRLLSVPFAVEAEAVANVLGAELFVWENRKFSPASGTLKAGRGFIAFIPANPSNVQISGDRSVVHPIANGWNLVGPTLDAQPADKPRFTLKDRCYIRDDGEVAVGGACWMFVK
ncbi:MAG: hypothetical protein J5833_04945 [Victivallales bacterium]|nr:hypothetical protein [Victivallales bacterium]